MPKTKPLKIYLKVMSISKAQANLLATSFLDTLPGEEKSVLQPKETYSELFVIAGELVDMAQNNLNDSNSNSSGGLSKSLVLDEPKQNGNIVSVNMLMNEYGKYINKGVRGTVSGSGLYKFKNNNPSSKMLANLQRSKIKSKRKIVNTNPKKSVSKNEIKNANIAKIQAWGAAVNIKKFGIKPTGFLDKAVNVTERKIEDRLSAAFKIDILNSI